MENNKLSKTEQNLAIEKLTAYDLELLTLIKVEAKLLGKSPKDVLLMRINEIVE